jgi:hypothetical protein
MKEARTITIDTLRPLRRATGAGVLYESPRRASADTVMVSCYVADTERRTAQLNGKR